MFRLIINVLAAMRIYYVPPLYMGVIGAIVCFRTLLIGIK